MSRQVRIGTLHSNCKGRVERRSGGACQWALEEGSGPCDSRVFGESWTMEPEEVAFRVLREQGTPLSRDYGVPIPKSPPFAQYGTSRLYS